MLGVPILICWLQSKFAEHFWLVVNLLMHALLEVKNVNVKLLWISKLLFFLAISYCKTTPPEDWYSCVQIDLPDSEITLQPFWPDEHHTFGQMGFSLVLTLIKIAHVERLEVCIYRNIENREDIKRFVQVCKLFEGKFWKINIGN